MKRAILLFLIVAITMMFVGCSSNNINDNKRVNDYGIYEKEYTAYNNEKQPFIVKYAQISGLGNESLENKTNQTLKESITAWINETCEWMERSEIVVKYKTPKYLSLCYVIEWNNSQKNGYMRIGITVDMQTGDRVYLNDLIKNTTNLKQKLVSYSYGTEFSPPIDSEEADKIIHSASISETKYLEEIFKDDPYAYNHINSYFTAKSSFYLTDNKLVITRDKYELNDINIDFKQ
jgi:hypothetical protein